MRIFFSFTLMKRKLDSTDRRLLDILQKNAETPLAELAEAVNLSSTPCWRRVQRLKEWGFVRRQVALVDPRLVNVGVTVFVLIKTSQHNQAWFERFRQAVADIDEVLELHRMSSDVDYLMKVVVPDIAAYNEVYQRLIRSVDFTDVSSSFVMEEIKNTTALPLKYAD